MLSFILKRLAVVFAAAVICVANEILAKPIMPDYSSLKNPEASEDKRIESSSNGNVLDRIKQDALSCKGEWTGTQADLELIIAKAKENYGFEESKHLGRNATMPVPATLKEMEKEIKKYGNKDGWDGPKMWDGWHNPDAKKEDGWGEAALNSINSGVEKYVNKFGDEVVYDKETGKILSDRHMGTKNFSVENEGSHKNLDVNPHRANDDYKYVGILYERDSHNPDRYYIIDGQTGKRMTYKQVEEFPTTLSDMWKDKGLMCVAEDEKDLVVNTSKLEALTKRMIDFEQGLLDAGEKATETQVSTYNAYADKARKELIRLLRPIQALPISDAEKVKIANDRILGKLKPSVERLQALQKQLISRGLVGGLKPVSLDSLDLEELGQSKKDSDSCSCASPDYKATIPPAGPGWATCTKCGKSLGTIVNGRVISTNPAVNGKSVK